MINDDRMERESPPPPSSRRAEAHRKTSDLFHRLTRRQRHYLAGLAVGKTKQRAASLCHRLSHGNSRTLKLSDKLLQGQCLNPACDRDRRSLKPGLPMDQD